MGRALAAAMARQVRRHGNGMVVAHLDNAPMTVYQTQRVWGGWPLRAAHVVSVGCVLVLALASCTPTLDWREVRPVGSGAVLLVPCKPSGHERRLLLAGQAVRLTLHACSAGDQTWSLAFADVADPARMGDVLQELVRAAGANVSAAAAQQLPLAVPGATPNAANQMVLYQGRLPDGQAVHMQVAVFARGLRAFQATVLGGSLTAESVQTFMGSIRFVD